MTITDMAKQLNVSTMTVYRRCKKNSIDVGELRDDKTGELTADGVALIASLFDTTTPQMTVTGDITQIQPDTQPTPQTVSHGLSDASMAVRVAELTATVDGLRLLVDQLTGERDDLRQQVTALTAALEREQEQSRRLLTGGVEDGQTRRRWRWPWQR